jgi:hypothetical protein
VDEGRGLRRTPARQGIITLGLQIWTPPRMNATRENPRDSLDEIATSIKRLILYLESRELEGRSLTATEISTIAKTLQLHVEDLHAASRSLREEKVDN